MKPKNKKQPKRKFIAVVHNWFVVSHGFEIREFEVDTYEQAITRANELNCNYNYPFNKAAVKLIEIEPDDTAKYCEDKKITLREKMFKRVKNGIRSWR